MKNTTEEITSNMGISYQVSFFKVCFLLFSLLVRLMIPQAAFTRLKIRAINSFCGLCLY